VTGLTQKTLCRVIWRRNLDDHSFEECVVTASPAGFGIGGHVIAAQDGAPLVVRYEIGCDDAWSARSVTIEQRLGDTQRRLRLERAGDGWLVDGVHDARLDRCAEPDLGLTPSTNALAVRRLGLAMGQAAEIKCAWVKFPALSVEPSLQRYQRLGDHDYRYTNVASGFTALVAVDALALPVSYEGIWTRIADWQGDGS
jgi:uncharacterized protein